MTTTGIAPAMEHAVGDTLNRLARGLALFGGAVFVALAIMTVISIMGRSLIFLGFGPVPGDFELVQAGCAVAIFSFLPWCQMRRGQVTVDVLVDYFPPRIRALLSMLGNSALTFAAMVIAWQMTFGMIDKYYNGEETWILGMPVWWGYALSMIGAALFAVVATFTVWRSLNEALRGEEAAS